MNDLLPIDLEEMSGLLTELAGWIPAIILPAATVSQLIKIVRSRSVEGISLATWLLFGIANVGLYVFTEKYFALQSLLGLLGTAIMDFVIVIMIITLKEDRELNLEEIKAEEIAYGVSEASEAQRSNSAPCSRTTENTSLG